MTVCSIIPPHLLQNIASSQEVDASVRSCHQKTFDNTIHIRSARRSHTQQLHQHAHSQGFIPPHVHEALAENADHEPSINTLAQDQEMRDARAGKATPATKSGLSRTIYDGEHTENQNDLPGDVVLIKEGGSPVPTSKDPSNDANECYTNFGYTYNFYKEFFKRNSLDNKGMKLIGTVHFGVDYQNAFWDGKQMVFGDGDKVIFTQFTGITDVVGHELTHGVVQYTCNLDYEGQPGALNESLADCFGIMVRQWSEKQTPENARWVIGEGIFAKGINGRGLRDMKAPGTAYDDPRLGKDPQPATMAGYQNMPNTDQGDNGGVHINSGIPNHAFYLAATKIGGNSWEGAGPIWYKAITDPKLKSSASFKDFAQVTVNNAGSHAKEVKAAWEEVGITGLTAGKDSGDL